MTKFTWPIGRTQLRRASIPCENPDMLDANALTAQSPTEGSQAICRACGLCCRGVWFSHVTLEPGELDQARLAGLAVETVDGASSFQQPCVLHRDDGCSAYGTWRPKTCVNYTCALLNRFQANEVSFDEAMKHVGAARKMADRLQDEAGPNARGLKGKAIMSRLVQPSGDTSEVKPLSPAAKLDTVTLRVYFTKYFQKKPESTDAQI